MSKSNIQVNDLKDTYATNKIKDEIEWGIHIRETRLQGRQIELTTRTVEAPPAPSYRRIKKRKRRKKKSSSKPPASPNKILNRNTCTRNQYINMLATPRVFVTEPEQKEPKPSTKPCPPRFVQLAFPKKQHLFNTWQDFQTTLPANKIVGLQQLLEKEEALGPKDAFRYFKRLDMKRKKKRKEKAKKEKETKLTKPRKTKLMKELNKLVDSIFNFLVQKSTSNVKYKHMMITEIVKQKLEERKLIKSYKRSDNKDIKAKTVHEVLDQLAVWLDSNIEMDDEESDDEADALTRGISEESTVSSITYINLLLSISDSMESKVVEAEKASVATMHEIEEVLEEMYQLSETEMEMFEEALSIEAEEEEEILIFPEDEGEEEGDRDSGIVSDMDEELLSETEDEGFGETEEELGDTAGEEEISEADEIEGEEEEEELEAQEEEEVEAEEEEITEVEEPEKKESGVEIAEEAQELEEEEEVMRSTFEEEKPEDVLTLEEKPEEGEPEVKETPEEKPEAREDVEQMQRDLLNEFYEQQVKQLLVSKEEISVMESKPPSLILEGSLLEIARRESISVEEHSPDAICCVSMKTWATWLLDVAENTQSWCQWIQRTIAKLRYYAAVLKGEVRTDDGKMKSLSKEEWAAFVDTVEKDIIAWRQYNMHVQDLSQEIIESFANKRVICCPECLKSKLILSEETAHEVSKHLVEAIKTSAYWRRWLNAVLLETEKVTALQIEIPASSAEEPGTSATCSVYELIEIKCPDAAKKKESSQSIFILEEI